MKSYISVIGGLAIFQNLVVSVTIPSYFQTSPTTSRQISTAAVQKELGSRLSNSSAIFGPDDSRYNESTARWDNFAVPQVQLVIEPGTESDVPKIVSTINLYYFFSIQLTVTKVKYCNQHNIDFLAINRGHGSAQSLGSFNGIQINMVNLHNITIQPDGKSAWFQGGTYDGQVSRYLWEEGYVATTGSCDCVGLMGAGLGGGHGRHEGLYGMVSDNLLQLNLVLGDGTTIRVNNNSHSDLLWGMKGAGHNFGIVTSFEMKIYPRGPDTWHYHNYIWTGDKLVNVFNTLNAFHRNGSTPVNMTTNFGNFFMNSSISTTEPIIWWTFSYRGSEEEAEKLLAPFNAIGSVYEESGNIPYPEVAHAQQTGEEDAICQDGVIRITSTSGLQVYNVTAEQQIWNSFVQRLKTNNELAQGGIILHEGYSTAAVEAINGDTSAYPFRADHHLMLFQGLIAPDSGLEDAAWEWAYEVRDLWNGGQPNRLPDAYLNYANGFEPLEQRFGHEPWRLERLRNLKAKYDPKNRFRYFNPIVQEPSNYTNPINPGNYTTPSYKRSEVH